MSSSGLLGSRTPRARSGSTMGDALPAGVAPPGATTIELLQELRRVVTTSAGSLDAAHDRILGLIDRLETSLVVARAEERRPSISPEEMKRLQVAKIDKFLVTIPEKRITKPASPFMVNDLMSAEAVFTAAGSDRRGPGSQLKTGRTMKRDSKVYVKRSDEVKKLLAHMCKQLDNDLKLHSDVGALHKMLHADPNGEALFFEAEGSRQLEAMIFSRGISGSALVTLLALFFSVMKLPMFPFEQLLKGKPPFMSRALELLCSRTEVHVQRAVLYILADIVECADSDSFQVVLGTMNTFSDTHLDTLHPLDMVVDAMVTQRDGIVVASGLRLVNALIKSAEASQTQDVLMNLLEGTSYHRAMVQFTASPTAQALPELSLELKKYQAWWLRDCKRRVFEKFSLADAAHRQLLVDLWALRHKDVPCPVTADSWGYTEETKDHWLDLGFFNEVSSYFPSLIRAQDMHHYATQRTAQWLGLLDKLSATRKMAEKAKGASIGKVDFDVAGISVGLSSRVVELITAPVALVPAQRILWEDSGRAAIYSAGMEMARTVFTGYKLFDRNNTKQLLEDTMRTLAEALNSVPPTEDYLFRLMAFFGQRSSEQDRQKTIRGSGMGKVEKKGSGADLLKQMAAAVPGAPSGSSTWKTQFQRLYRPSLDEFEPGPGGVPLLVCELTEAVLSCGGESSVGLFRIQPSSEALQACEERLDAGSRGAEVFRGVDDPNIPGMILKRILTALDPPLIDKYSAVVEAVRLSQFSLLTEVLKKLDPVNKATLNYLMNFLRYLSDPAVVEKTKMDPSNVCMVFAPTMLRDPDRGDRPSFGASFLEKDLVLYLSQVSDPIP